MDHTLPYISRTPLSTHRYKLHLPIGSEVFALASGDAAYFDAAARHRYRRLSKGGPCSAVIVTT